jgi:hypothetical protein
MIVINQKIRMIDSVIKNTLYLRISLNEYTKRRGGHWHAKEKLIKENEKRAKYDVDSDWT